jgi:3',5'-cyclic AMP phosphodiesterase CpdA
MGRHPKRRFDLIETKFERVSQAATDQFRSRAIDSGIWDLRRGDADDNRTSPYGRGMWKVVLSAALDFNILKASVAALVLIIGPALLVGLMPSIAVYVARLTLEVANFWGNHPLIIILLLAVLSIAAFAIGRPLLLRAVDTFWHLHYTLIFPAIVVLREILQIVAERAPGRPRTPEQLHRRRRAASVLAALLLASAGAALAWRVGGSLGLQLIDAGQIRPWAAVKTAMGNAALVLGLSTVVESGYWLWRELTLHDPVLDWHGSAPGPSFTTNRMAHLSDLHIVGGRYHFRMESGLLGPQGNECIHKALRKLSTIQAHAPLGWIVMTGDVTDDGTRAEWTEFLDLLQDYPEIRRRLYFVPGNHDVNIVDRAHPALIDLPWSTGQALRKLRVILTLDEVQGERVHLVDRSSGAPGASLRDYLREGKRAELLAALAQNGSADGRREVTKIWETIFPLVEPAGDNTPGVILLNSNARSHFSLTNAIGVIDRSQLRTLRSIFRSSPAHAWLILLHHQVVEYPLTSIGLRDRIGLALVNAPDVLAAIKPHASRTLVLHGHRHRDWIGVCGGVTLCSAPSTALGSYGGEMYEGSFHIHELDTGVGGSVRLVTTERVKVT